MKGENVHRVRKNVEGLRVPLQPPYLCDKNVLFRISLDVVVVEI
jgi:hypothetical protein